MEAARASKVRVDTHIADTQSEGKGDFTSSTGVTLKYQFWNTSSKCIGSAILVHGMGDHSGHMMTVVERFVKFGFNVYSYDQQGHGDSPGQRGHITHWNDFRNDLTSFVDFVSKKAENHSVILFGNSMGGAVVLDYAMRTPSECVKGLIVNGPALTLVDVGAVTGAILKLGSMISPTSSLDAKLDSSKLSRDSEKIKENDTDMLVHTSCSLQLLTQLRNTGKWIQKNPQLLKLPALLLQGLADPIVHPTVNVKFFEKVESTNSKASHLATEGGKHETFNDSDRSQVLDKCCQFVDQVLNQTNTTSNTQPQ